MRWRNSFTNKVDQAMLGLYTKVAEKYQEKTGKPKQELATGLYLLSSTLFGYAAIEMALANQYLFATTKTALGLLTMYEGEHRRRVPSSFTDFEPTAQAIRVNSIFLAPFMAPLVWAGKQLKEVEELEELGGTLVGLAVTGIGYFTFKSAEYISIADVDPPPKKEKKESLTARIVKSFLPQTVRTYRFEQAMDQYSYKFSKI